MRGLLRALVRRWPLKLLALGLAIVVWAAVTGENPIVQDYKVPLDVSVGSQWLVSSSPPSAANVRLRGTESMLRRVDPLALGLRVDLRNAAAGEHNVQLGAAQMTGVPQGVDVESIEPGRVKVVLARKLRRMLPVSPTVSGSAAPGYATYGFEVRPDTVEVEGPAAKLEAVNRIRTDAIPLDGRSASFSVRVNALPESAALRVLDPRPLDVRVLVDVAPKEMAFDGVPVAFSGQTYETTAVPSTVRVVIAGPPASLSRLKARQIRAVVDLTGLTPRGQLQGAPVRVDLSAVPEKDRALLSVKSLNRPRIDVRVSPRRIAS